MAQAVRLKRSEKTYLAGMRAINKRLSEEARELNWLDKNIELISASRLNELKNLWVVVR